MIFEFELSIRLDVNEDPELYLDKLFEAGCDDANVGIGKKGFIGLAFQREASCASEAVKSALSDIFKAIPHATLHQATPYLQNISELAEQFGLTKQNMRLYANDQTATQKRPFPAPIVSGSRTSFWLTSEIAIWLRDQADFMIAEETIDLLHVLHALNQANEIIHQPNPELTQSLADFLKKKAA